MSSSATTGEYSVHFTKLGKFLLRKADDIIDDQLIQGNLWESEIQPILDKLKPSDVVVEVGSYIGDHTVYIAKRCAKVYAFECCTRNYYQLCANLFLNDCENVVAENKCIGKEIGKLRASSIERNDPYAPKPTNKSGIPYLKDSDGDKGVYPLDSLLNLDRLDLLKIDTEGMDLDVMLGASYHIYKHKPTIIFEFNGVVSDQDISEYVEFLTGFGYTVEQIEGWNWLAWQGG